MMKKLSIVVMLAIGLGGCASVERSFLESTPEQRASIVCRYAKPLADQNNLLTAARDRLAEAKANIRRGYAVHEDYFSFSSSDFQSLSGINSTPVAINVEKEEEKAQQLMKFIEREDAVLTEMTDRCVHTVRSMPPEEAYRYYQARQCPDF